ncbi:hypothetical protein FHR92_002999 [Fontibacillus solani]|uniref:Uncharacterized protein n=1 Tax=Fontibacillus solani TaxID=1572857 RepID=A0A7W3SUJ2_9BACL|nr:hypothetical protein [Fontibacillus solani]MBA9086521.1 hypothetical protein [Fontibacillus solani]
MKDATVTIGYESFQTIRTKADKYDKLISAREDAASKERSFIDQLVTSIEKANECPTAEQKQYHIALGIRAICEYFDYDLKAEYGELDAGQAY